MSAIAVFVLGLVVGIVVATVGWALWAHEAMK